MHDKHGLNLKYSIKKMCVYLAYLIGSTEYKSISALRAHIDSQAK